jgi:hypothetical protein
MVKITGAFVEDGEKGESVVLESVGKNGRFFYLSTCVYLVTMLHWELLEMNIVKIYHNIPFIFIYLYNY